MVHGEVVPEGASTCHLICQFKMTLFVGSDLHSRIPNSLNLNKRCKSTEQHTWSVGGEEQVHPLGQGEGGRGGEEGTV